MQPVPKTPTTALVLETNNLAGGRGDPDGVEHSLARLLGICARRRDRWPRWMKWWSCTRGSRRQRRIACETWRVARCDS